jgi:hypothetical protein
MDTFCVVLPKTESGKAVIDDPYKSLGPYSNVTEEGEFPGFTSPFSLAESPVMSVALYVFTTGGLTRVVNVVSFP